MKMRAAIQMLVLFLAGCAGSNDSFPSLARRPVEQRASEAPPAPPAEEVVAAEAEPELRRTIDGLVERARSGQAAFDGHVDAARKIVEAATGAAVSSEPWVAAQEAISTLESDRYDSVFALASLDTLYVERQDAVAKGDARGGIDAIDSARAAVLAMVDRQNDLLDILKDRLAAPAQ